MADARNVSLLKEGQVVEGLPMGVELSEDMSKMCMPVHFNMAMSYFSRQLCLSMVIAVATNLLLDPFGIPTSVSHLVAGFMMGPSVLGLIDGYKEFLLPLSTSIMIDSYAALGMLFQLFLIGVQVNPSLILKAGRKAVCIGTLVVVIPLVLASTTALAISSLIDVHDDGTESIFTVGIVQSISSFPVIVFYMYEINIVSLEFSHIAYSCSVISGLLCASLLGATMLYFTNTNPEMILVSLAAHVVVVLLILYVVRPGINWINSRVREGQTVRELYMCPVYVAVLVVALMCMYGRVSWMFGPFLFGMIIPAGSPLGTTLVRRFETFNTWMMMPVFYLAHGVMVDVSSLSSQRGLLKELVVVVSYMGKFLGATLPALYYHMSVREAILLGLTVNVQGFLEIAGYRILKMTNIISHESFQVMSTSMIFTTVVLTPLLAYLYKQSQKNKVNEKGIQLHEPNMELRVLACVYNQENVPSIIHLLKAINPTQDSPVDLSLIHFVERVGHATPLIINHTTQTQQSSAIAGSQRIINVFKSYQDRNRHRISVHPYTVVSHYSSLSKDVCTLAEQQRTSLVLLPYHKELATGVLNKDLRTVNCEILDKTTCAVGIVIDRGLQGGIKFVLENWSSYRVAMIFFGGADDREALSHAARMSTHPAIELTVIKLLTDYPNPTYTAKTEMALDDEVVGDFKKTFSYNNRITLVEEEVEDGIQVVKLLETMEESYELIILGRHHDQNSPLILGLTEWNECSELGTIGDLFTTSNFGGKSTIFIVQQHKNAARRAGSFAQDEDVMFHSYQEDVPFRDEDTLSSC